MTGKGSTIGVELAQRIGLTINRTEGHDLAGPCISCKSSDAFRMHMQTGVAQCYSCGGKWSPFHVAEMALRDREQAKAVMRELGLFKPARGPNAQPQSIPPPNPIAMIAKAKAVTPESLRAFGAKAVTPYTVRLPAYGPDGRACTHFDISVRGGKGKFAYRRPAGLFFPHEDGKVRLPQRGETWHLVEGPKDAAALHGMGYLACGLNTCRLAAKFARLFAGVNMVLVPDRDKAGEGGSQHSTRALRGVAESTRIATLPAEFKESNGADVRDVLRQPNGEQLVRQALADAVLVESGPQNGHGSQGDVCAEIELPDGNPLMLTVSSAGKKPQRLVVALRGNDSHRDRINTDSSISRERFSKKLAAKLGVEPDVLGPLIDHKLSELAGEADQQAGSGGDDGDDQESQATIAAKMAAEWDLWHTPAGDAYATVPVGDHEETWPIKSVTFRRYVCTFRKTAGGRLFRKCEELRSTKKGSSVMLW